jgi:HTH-type transcriptional regulator, competence development regulator
MDNFGEYVRELRKRNRLTLKQAEKLGVASNAYLSQLERGRRKNPHLDILKRMADVYNVTLEELLIKAGYLTPEKPLKSEKEQIEDAYQRVQNDQRVAHGTRRKGLNLNLEAKRYIVEMYENLTGRKLL